VRDGFVYFTLLTGEGKLEIEVAPEEYFRRRGFTLRLGEMISVLGMPAVVRDWPIVMAREIKTRESILVLRNREGRPMWDTHAPVPMDPERRVEPFEVCGEFSLEKIR
jgi:hypothetical protein